MEIEVGEYVRIENDIRLLAVGIGKVERIDNRGETIYIKRDNLPISINITKITKHSKKLIDLIEIGDYVNGNKVEDKYLLNGEKPVLETAGKEKNSFCLCERDIREVLTHEQYEANSFRRAKVENEQYN